MEKGGSQGGCGDCRPLTTFVRTDTNTFREIVQRLTSPSDPTTNATSPSHDQGPGGPNKVPGLKRPTGSSSPRSSTILERRQYNSRNRPKLQIAKLPQTRARSTGSFSAELKSLSPSPAVTPTSIFSRLSLVHEIMDDAGIPVVLNKEGEEKAIKERRFYLHPSPRSRARASQPELLDLFPTTSSRVSGTDPGGG